MASPVRSILPRLEPTASPRQPPALTDDLLQEIFLRVASHADLACVSFRRLVADPNFQRRYRSRHPPLLLGFLGVFEFEGFRPVKAPHRNAPAAHALGTAAGFSFDYLPRRGELMWSPRDVRDGRVLLGRNPIHWTGANSFAFGDLAVCDPLSRQYLLLPRIPEDLIASVHIIKGHIDDVGATLVPSGDWEETSFRALCSIHSGARLVVCIFSSASGCWIVGASTSWDALGLNIPPRKLVLGWAGRQPQFAYGCCYWKVKDQNELLKLDMNTMGFSIVELPAGHNGRSIAVVEADEGNLGMFSEVRNIEGTFVEYYTSMQNGSERADEWDFENTTPTAHFHGFIGSGGGYVFLADRPEFSAGLLHAQYVCSSLEIKTSNIESVNKMVSPFCYPYFGFPPSMSPRRIQGYEATQG